MATTDISCPHCQAKNRLPSNRLGDGPSCGKCKKALFIGKPLELNSSNVNGVLVNNDIPILVDCWAPWCGPCVGFAPIFEKAAEYFEPNLRLAKLNTEAEQSIAGKWNIRSIPTLLLFKNGKEIARQAGALPLPQLKAWVQQQL